MYLQASEEQDASGEVPSKNDKGIEMEEDFAADTFSVSEDSEDDANEDDADEHLESAMGETGVDGETVDEKLWNKDEDENLNNSNEKYESGNSVNDRDASSRELRAKDDSAAATNEPGELDLNEIDEDNGEIGSQDDLNDVESVEDMNLDKQEAVVDPTGLNPDDLNQNSDETMELDDPEMHDEHAKNEDHEEEQAFSTDETMGEAETEQIDATPERDDASKDHEDNPEINSGLSKDVFELGESDSMRDDVPNTEPSTQPKSDLKASDPRDVAPESNWANSNDIHNELTPMRGLPSTNTSELDMMISEASDNGKNVAEQPKSQLPRQESSSERKTKPNPYRSVGDALKEWEERVRVSVDLQEGDVEPQDEIKNENADEFGYVSEYEKGTAQALGPATSEQIDRNVDDNKSNAGEDDRTTHKDGLVDMEIENKKYEAQPSRSRASMLQDKIEDQMHLSGIEKLPGDEYQDIHSRHDGDPETIVEDVVSVKTSYFSDDMHQLSKLSVNDSDMGKAQVAGEFSDDVVGNATVLWRRYEQTTTRLSQELAEQLRLVMEPNRASKLEGDYKTGKRINMKKVRCKIIQCDHFNFCKHILISFPSDVKFLR